MALETKLRLNLVLNNKLAKLFNLMKDGSDRQEHFAQSAQIG